MDSTATPGCIRNGTWKSVKSFSDLESPVQFDIDSLILIGPDRELSYLNSRQDFKCPLDREEARLWDDKKVVFFCNI